jgi:hypothetical protein
MAGHGSQARGNVPDALRSAANADPGLFGRMFDLPPLIVSDHILSELSAEMLNSGRSSNPAIPAGFTYLGQFIDHDITLDLTSIGEKASDPNGVENFRTPSLDLDSIYGLGPDGSPHLFMRDANTLKVGAQFLLGSAIDSEKLVGPGKIPLLPGFDLPRQPQTGTAIIGDPRNDENLLVAQMHVAFLRFHNAVVQANPGISFAAARRKVVWHYQWLVLHEFLETITGEKGIAARILHRGRRFFRFRKHPWMPIEFAAAAYRFGHSLVRAGYSHNFVFRPGGATVATLRLLFDFTAKSGRIVGTLSPPAVPLPQPALPSNWVVDWRRFFDFGTAPGTPEFEFNAAEMLDPFLVKDLHELPGATPGTPQARLAFLNLKRGVKMGLPSGQDVANAIGVPPLTAQEVSQGPDGAVAAKHGLDNQTPLWYYILKEAEVRHGGRHLGAVGATIVAEVFVGLVQGDPNSYLSASPAFSPDLGSSGDFKMTDLLRVAQFINPLEAHR